MFLCRDPQVYSTEPFLEKEPLMPTKWTKRCHGANTPPGMENPLHLSKTKKKVPKPKLLQEWNHLHMSNIPPKKNRVDNNDPSLKPMSRGTGYPQIRSTSSAEFFVRHPGSQVYRILLSCSVTLEKKGTLFLAWTEF